jgi:hypothetical protein
VRQGIEGHYRSRGFAAHGIACPLGRAVTAGDGFGRLPLHLQPNDHKDKADQPEVPTSEVRSRSIRAAWGQPWNLAPVEIGEQR